GHRPDDQPLPEAPDRQHHREGDDSPVQDGHPHIQPASFLPVSKLMFGEATATTQPSKAVCPHFHAAIELIGKRWTGAILSALTERPMRFGELGKDVPGLSDLLPLPPL